jgi:hypothetical protein
MAASAGLAPSPEQTRATLIALAQVAKNLFLVRAGPGRTLIPRLWLSIELSPVGCGGVGTRAMRVWLSRLHAAARRSLTSGSSVSR